MAMYESIFILDSLLTPEEIEKTIERIKDVITGNKGKVLTVDKWGKRRLAYEIQKKQYGFYVAIEFEAEGNLPLILQNEYNYNDKVIRYLTYRYTKNKIKAREKEIEMNKHRAENLAIENENEVESAEVEKVEIVEADDE